jgi:hypothetical protein
MTGPVAGKGQGVPAQEEHLPLPHFSMHFRADDTFISERRHSLTGSLRWGVRTPVSAQKWRALRG